MNTMEQVFGITHGHRRTDSPKVCRHSSQKERNDKSPYCCFLAVFNVFSESLLSLETETKQHYT